MASLAIDRQIVSRERVGLAGFQGGYGFCHRRGFLFPTRRITLRGVIQRERSDIIFQLCQIRFAGLAFVGFQEWINPRAIPTPRIVSTSRPTFSGRYTVYR